MMANYYNILFLQSSDKKFSAIDKLGYCYMKQAMSSSDSYDFNEYTYGDGAIFTQLFKMGSGMQYLNFTSNEQGQINEDTITGDISSATMLFPIFPTFVTGKGEALTIPITMTENL
ncbi:unnamed protein product [Ambrosiozyma monospora]|uniref:Unnamed protein product n=1 Tax=Ambrosiozyma monospora TaxID=43982 RepID=A0A9W6SX20_AMBMO|nr:unnamed protein product [Ambrosiozyma monospora]